MTYHSRSHAPIRFTCRCGKALKAPERLAGKGSRCPACGADVMVPDPAELLADDDFKLKPRAPEHNQHPQIVFASVEEDSAATLVRRGGSRTWPTLSASAGL